MWYGVIMGLRLQHIGVAAYWGYSITWAVTVCADVSLLLYST